MKTIKLIFVCILLLFSGCTNQEDINKNREIIQKEDINYIYESVITFDSINSLATDIKSADINSDGLIDIIIATAKISPPNYLENSDSNNHENKPNNNKEFIGKDEIIIYINKGSWNFNEIHIPIKEGMGATGELSIQDIDFDGDLDIIVGIMGELRVTTSKKIGGVIIIENILNENYQTFKSHIIARNLSRVVKVLAKDLDKDGDKDLIVAAFGSEGVAQENGEGNIYLLKNKDGKWNFETNILSNIEGSLDIIDISSTVKDEYPIMAVLVSEGHEKIISFNFKEISNIHENEIYSINKTEWGSLRLELSDLDNDGDKDLIWINGDMDDINNMQIIKLHGISWIEQEKGKFTKFHNIGKLPGAYNGIPIDYDNDGHTDIITSQMFIDVNEQTKTYIGVYKNKGDGNFLDYKVLAKDPVSAIVMSVGDYDNDGDIDISYQDSMSFNINILENKLK